MPIIIRIGSTIKIRKFLLLRNYRGFRCGLYALLQVFIFGFLEAKVMY